MITQAILDVLTTMMNFVYGLIPSNWTPPAWVAGSVDSMAGLFTATSTMGTWIPLAFALICGQAIMTTYIGGGVVKLIRILVSHFTGGGGSAA